MENDLRERTMDIALRSETNELTAIFTTIHKNAKE